MKILMAIVMFICSLIFGGGNDKTAKSWYTPDQNTDTSYSQEKPADEDDLGPAIRLNPDTGMYETSDGVSWPAT